MSLRSKLILALFSWCIICTNCRADLSQKQQQAIVCLHDSHCFPQGTAFFVTSTRLRTAAHIPAECYRLHFHAGGKTVDCTVESVNQYRDTATLATVGFKSSVSLQTSTNVRSNQPVRVYGYPLSGYTTTVGVVTRVDSVNHYDGIAHPVSECTAQIMGGFSGAPVIDRQTNLVIGIATSNEHGNQRYSDCRFARAR